jgi:hypothetical protein
MTTIRVGEKVTYQGDTTQGTVTEIWKSKRANVTWADGTSAWVPLNSLRTVAVEQLATRPRGCECASGAYGGVCTCR